MIKTKLVNAILCKILSDQVQVYKMVKRQYYLIVREGRLPGLHPHECAQQGDKIVYVLAKKTKTNNN